MTQYRKERLNEAIKEILGELIQAGLKDPRVGLVTITSVEVSKDVSSAKVFFTVFGDEQAREDSLAGLKSARNYLRKTIGRELKLRNAPELRFAYDDTLDRSIALEEALNKIDLKEEESEEEA